MTMPRPFAPVGILDRLYVTCGDPSGLRVVPGERGRGGPPLANVHVEPAA
jgi:hypothetical protein